MEPATNNTDNISTQSLKKNVIGKSEMSTVFNYSSTENKYQFNEYAEIQAQFELYVELNRFINIDLFQRGFYQVRVSINVHNKTFPTKITVQHVKNPNNNHLSGNYF
jgi:hypothetical protein